jgi:hypothetical protein
VGLFPLAPKGDEMQPQAHPITIGRREFFGWSARGIVRIGLLGAAPAILTACGRDGAEPGGVATGVSPAPSTQEEAIVGDVIDYALTSDGWPGAFGFVTFRLHRGTFDGRDVYFIRTDTSDESYAAQEKLVWAPRLSSLIHEDLTGSAYVVTGATTDQPTVLSSEPGQPDYTPAWRLHEVSWKEAPEPLTSADQVEQARAAGRLSVEATNVVLNAAVVKWSAGEMPADTERSEYLGGGQLLEPPDTSGLTVTFKLHECFPSVRYIVLDTSIAPMAEGMHIVHSPRLAESPEAGATGRTNVFMNGLKGPGPMGFQPSVFDSQAGNPAWSPYWDHMTYAWVDGEQPRVLRTEREVHGARDAGDLDEFPGTPDTKGQIFTVNCPVPILAPNTFTG